MKILVLANVGMWVYKLRRELLESIAKTHEVHVSCIKDDYIDKIVDMGCSYIDTEFDKRGTNPIKESKLLFFYIKTIKKLKPDIVLTFTIKPNIYGGIACRLCKAPYISNVTGLGTVFQTENLMKKLVAVFYKSVLNKASCAFFQNRENMDFFINDKVTPENYRLIPGSGVNLDHFTALEYPLDDVVKFVSITRILKEKGMDEYLAAAKYVSEKYGNVEFHICGFLEDDYEGVLKEYDRAGIIKYHGIIDDVRDILAETHCTILPSYHEGMSNVLLESAACARPVITTDISGCREIVDDGINGYLVDVADSDSLIEKIEKFLALPYEEKKSMGIAGRKKVEKEFSREIVISSYMDEIIL